jgi:hypothetical protein
VQVSIGGTVSSSLATPLYPVSTIANSSASITFVTATGYLATFGPNGALQTVQANFVNGATGCPAGANILVAEGLFLPGTLFRIQSGAVYYIPKSPTVTTDPTRGSVLTTGGTCNAGSASTGNFLTALPVTGAAITTTGFGIAGAGHSFTFAYVP